MPVCIPWLFVSRGCLCPMGACVPCPCVPLAACVPWLPVPHGCVSPEGHVCPELCVPHGYVSPTAACAHGHVCPADIHHPPAHSPVAPTTITQCILFVGNFKFQVSSSPARSILYQAEWYSRMTLYKDGFSDKMPPVFYS